MLNEICVGDAIHFWEPNMVSFRSNVGLWISEERGRRWIYARVTHKTKTGRISMKVIVADGENAPCRDKKISRKPQQLFGAFASLELRSKGERGKLLACTHNSAHPEAKKYFDMAGAMSRAPKNTEFKRRLSVYTDNVMRACHDDTARELKREQFE